MQKTINSSFQALDTALNEIVLPAMVEAYQKAKAQGYDVRGAFKADSDEIVRRLAEQTLSRAA